MFYIHQAICISPQQTFPVVDLENLELPVNNKLMAKEPGYETIPRNALRRMSKTVRMTVGAAIPIIQKHENISGIIMATANGGMEESISFLQQIVDYNEDMLAPGQFVQSTANAAAAQLSLITSNKNYNITHVHRGLAFENAAIDAFMQLKENPNSTYLLGGVDEIAVYNYKFEKLYGYYKEEEITNNLYNTDTPGTIAGEGAAIFAVNNNPSNAIAFVQAIQTIHTEDTDEIKETLEVFLSKCISSGNKIDLFLSGENGDIRLQQYYDACENLLNKNTGIAKFKHLCGEYATGSAFALWFACQIFQGATSLPSHTIKRLSTEKDIQTVLIYNNHKGQQHSFILIRR